jgi:hypothetical protein
LTTLNGKIPPLRQAPCPQTLLGEIRTWARDRRQCSHNP